MLSIGKWKKTVSQSISRRWMLKDRKPMPPPQPPTVHTHFNEIFYLNKIMTFSSLMPSSGFLSPGSKPCLPLQTYLLSAGPTNCLALSHSKICLQILPQLFVWGFISGPGSRLDHTEAKPEGCRVHATKKPSSNDRQGHVSSPRSLQLTPSSRGHSSPLNPMT